MSRQAFLPDWKREKKEFFIQNPENRRIMMCRTMNLSYRLRYTGNIRKFCVSAPYVGNRSRSGGILASGGSCHTSGHLSGGKPADRTVQRIPGYSPGIRRYGRRPFQSSLHRNREKSQSYEALLTAYSYMQQGSLDEAALALQNVKADVLPDSLKSIYESVRDATGVSGTGDTQDTSSDDGSGGGRIF